MQVYSDLEKGICRLVQVLGTVGEVWYYSDAHQLLISSTCTKLLHTLPDGAHACFVINSLLVIRCCGDAKNVSERTKNKVGSSPHWITELTSTSGIQHSFAIRYSPLHQLWLYGIICEVELICR